MSPARLVLSFFGCGLLPKVPGTWGTMGAALAAWAILEAWPGARADWFALCLGWVVTATIVTVLLAPMLEAEDGVKDPQSIVTDEVAGYFATVALARRPEVATLVVGFFVFRFLDVWKPWPARRLERLPGGWGVCLDDVAAGLYGAGVVWGLDRLIVLA